jgi:acyl carrier protein
MSDNERRLKAAFADVLEMPQSDVDDNVAYDKAKSWDSVAHMSLIAALDSAFDIMIDTDDVIEMSSYGKAREILKKYGVQF